MQTGDEDSAIRRFPSDDLLDGEVAAAELHATPLDAPRR